MKLKLVSWNVNGLRAVLRNGYFMPMIKTLKPDILCLQETKAEKGQAVVDLPEYEEYWNSAQKKGYAGTAIFTKAKPLSVILDIPENITKKYTLTDKYGAINKEGRMLALEFKDFYLVDVYTPNAKPDLSRLDMRDKHWDPAFLAYMKELNKKKPVIFCGDLNVAHTPDDLALPKQNEGGHGFTKEERSGIDKMIEAGFVDTFRTKHQGNGYYTWWSNFSAARDRNVGWRIDYFFVSRDGMKHVSEPKIHSDIYGSDHCPVSIEWK